MTLQDAHHNASHGAFPELPATPIDLSEMPTNPLMPSLLPADLSPRTPPTASTNNEIIIPNNAFPGHSQVGPPPFAPMPPMFPPDPPARSKRLDAKAILAICAALLLLFISVGGLIFNFVYYQPYRVHASATATAIVIPTTTARAEQTHVASYEQTQIALQQATATAEQNIYTQSISGKPFLNESLKQQSSSEWDEGVIWQNSSCTFKNGSYVVYQPNPGYFLPCFAEAPTFTNFALQVDINILKGDEGGVIFRGDTYYGDGYIFDIDTYGNVSLYRYTNKSTALFSSKSYDYKENQANRLTIIAIGNTFYFYLNQHFLDSATDKTFGQGAIGLLSHDYQDPTTVAYNNIKVWLLP